MQCCSAAVLQWGMLTIITPELSARHNTRSHDQRLSVSSSMMRDFLSFSTLKFRLFSWSAWLLHNVIRSCPWSVDSIYYLYSIVWSMGETGYAGKQPINFSNILSSDLRLPASSICLWWCPDVLVPGCYTHCGNGHRAQDSYWLWSHSRHKWRPRGDAACADHCRGDGWSVVDMYKIHFSI